MSQLLSDDGLRPGFVLDIGGEGRHRGAWNLNPCTRRTVQPGRGRPIRQLIVGRGENIPLSAHSIDVVIVERTPLRVRTLEEIRRVVKPGGWVILRHVPVPLGHPHLLARRLLLGRADCTIVRVNRRYVLQTTIRLEHWPSPPPVPLAVGAYSLAPRVSFQ